MPARRSTSRVNPGRGSTAMPAAARCSCPRAVAAATASNHGSAGLPSTNGSTTTASPSFERKNVEPSRAASGATTSGVEAASRRSRRCSHSTPAGSTGGRTKRTTTRSRSAAAAKMSFAYPPESRPSGSNRAQPKRSRRLADTAVTLAEPVTTTDRVIAEDAIRVLDHGFVRLDGSMATDLSVVNAARVSFARRKDEMDDADAGLIRFLMRDRHGTPFEHNSFRFHVRTPIFVAREWFRHRIGSFNEFSMRYARATDDFYVPAVEDVRTQVGKPGAYTFDEVEPELAEATRAELRAVYEAAYAVYQRLVEQGVAREVARCVLPVGAYTEFYWTVNARALMNFLSLRNAETAQREIRRYAEVCERFLEEKMPVTYAAFLANDRTAP